MVSYAKPEIVAVMTVTNPYQTRYWTYYAAVASWAQYCDRVIVVDGWSEEDLLEIPRSLFGDLSNVEVVRNERTYWGANHKWHPFQHGINLIEGIRAASKHSVVFVADADQVLYPPSRPLADSFTLASKVEKGVWFQFYRSKFNENQFKRRSDSRGRALYESLDSYLVFGYDLVRGIPSDFPIRPKVRSLFKDPVNGAVKTIFAGEHVDACDQLDIECGTFGHFWYSTDECLEKVKRWDIAFARGFGKAAARDLELLTKTKDISNIIGYRSKDEMLSFDFPPAMKRVVAEFYEPGMLGGAIYGNSLLRKYQKGFLYNLLYLERKFRTMMLRARGYRGLYDLHTWVPLDAPDPEPLDVRAVYLQQDRYLPQQYRLT